MRKKKGLLIDAGVGLVLTLVVMASYMRQWPLMAGVEFRAYDLRAKLRETLKSPDEIALVAIDDESIAQLGRWPWSRTKIAEGLDRIAAAHPKVIGLSVLFSEPAQSQGLAEVQRLQSKYKELVADHKILQKKGADFDAEFASSTVALDSDSRLLQSIQAAGNVVIPVFFAPNDAHGDMVAPPVEVSSDAIVAKVPPEPGLVQEKMIWPLPAFAGAAMGLGHSNLFAESDGVFRRDFPLMSYDGSYYPSYALRLAMAYVGAKPSDVRYSPGTAVSAGRLRVPVDDDGAMAVTFVGPPNAAASIIKRVSFASVVNGSTGANFFKDKIVLIGPTALGVGTTYVTPVAGDFPSVEIIAHILENILHNRYLTRPPWAVTFELSTMAVLGLFIMLILPRLRAFWGLVLSVLLAVMILGAGTYFFVAGQWLKVGYPLILLVAGYLIVISKSFLVTEKGKELVEASAIETNKMLGLSFQGQGMLDIAFEKFRLCPLDDNLKDTLYNLALDFERKRQFSKAASVLDHIAAKDPKYKDIAEKTKMLKAASEGAVFGGVGGGKKDGTVMIAGGSTKPTLGRYEIEKELGRGAMGVVYLGRDPKINRMVAIKTMMLEEGSDGGSLKEVKERFSREAESAGTLNHPNIVRIFDAGEENEVAYIAMELLDGQDLTTHVAKDALLPVGKAVEYAATVADALDYAHKQGIVHRDIKPANIMLLKDGSIRVADFGIARITASSKTATGTVMGTPSYMSPEQVAGRKVDGRSDLFSLTVALYELVTGEKPFKGGEGIGTLLFQIANDPTPDVLSINPALPPGLKAVIDKGLAKNPDERYQTGSELAAALRAALTGGAPAAASPAAAPVQRRVELTAEIPAPAPTPTPAPAPAPKPAAKTDEASKTVRLTGMNFPELDALKTMPSARPASPPPAERTAPIPDVTIPGLNDRPAPATPVPAPPPPPPAQGGLSIELPQQSGVGPAVDAPAPSRTDDPDATMRIEPTQNPDATLRLKPNPQEPL
jgi:serine/threonine-protein kinase